MSDKRWQPTDFQVQPDHHQQIGVAQFQQEAGFGFNIVRVLVALGDGFDINFVAADFLGERGHVGGGGDDVYLSRLRGQSHEDRQRKASSNRTNNIFERMNHDGS